MTKYRISLRNIKNISSLDAEFDFSEKNLILITGKNGSGKTSLVQSFGILSDIQIFEKISARNSIKQNSEISISIDGETFKYQYSSITKSLDIKKRIPKKSIIAELPIPYGSRFKHFPVIAKYDSDIRANIAKSSYETASDLIEFLALVYPQSEKIKTIKKTSIKNKIFYFILLESDYYLREDHFSSGEFFLIHLYRIITSKKTNEPRLIVIDEAEISFDASAQVKFTKAIEPILKKYKVNLLMISHSLPLIENTKEGSTYYQEFENNTHTLFKRSKGYIKSDLFSLKEKDRYILTEDKMFAGFIKYIIREEKLNHYFELEIVEAGGEPQIVNLANKNKESELFAPETDVLIIVDSDIYHKVKKQLREKKCNTEIISSPVEDIELFLWKNKAKFLNDVTLDQFTPSEKDKKTAKTYIKKLISSNQKTEDELYEIIKKESPKDKYNAFLQGIKKLLSLKNSQ